MTGLEYKADEAGVTPKEYLEAMFAEHVKTAVVALVMGLTVSTVYAYARQYGVKITKVKATVWVNGVKDTLENHCKAHNVACLSVRVRMSRYKLTPEQAIHDQIKNDRTHKRGAFKAQQEA